MGEMSGAYRVLVGIPEGKSPLGRPRRGWEDNFKTNLPIPTEWMGTRDCLDAVENRHISCSCSEPHHNSPAIQLTEWPQKQLKYSGLLVLQYLL
jgi:hypothetical protein